MKLMKLRENAVLPRRATPDSAGCDLCACLEQPLIISPGECRLIPTGWACDPERRDAAIFLFARSGLAAKHGLTLANGVGVVDADYRGEIMVAIRNQSTEPYILQPNERFAQMVMLPVLTPELTVTETLEETQRGGGGFGSSGKQ